MTANGITNLISIGHTLSITTATGPTVTAAAAAAAAATTTTTTTIYY